MEAPKFQKRSYYKHLISNVSSDRKTPKLFLNGPSPASFIIYFRSFQTNITIFTTIYVKQFPSSIRCRDSNPQQLGRESSPITTWSQAPTPNTSKVFGPCSSGQLVLLLLRRSEFQSRWRLQFFSLGFVFEKAKNKQKRGRGWPTLKKHLMCSFLKA